MLVLKELARNLIFNNAHRVCLIKHCASLHSSALLFSKTLSPDSSPVKIVVKKKRRISSSSEEETKESKVEARSPSK